MVVVDSMETAEQLCRSSGISPCFICDKPWCDIAVKGFKGIKITNIKDPWRMINYLSERAMIYEAVKQLFTYIAHRLDLELDEDVLTAVVSNIPTYGFPKCVCTRRTCPCLEILLVAMGKKECCTCRLFCRKKTPR